jgi:hypothetical protein
MTYDGANTYAYDPENRLVTVTRCADPLAAACDNEELAFTTGGAVVPCDIEIIGTVIRNDSGNRGLARAVWHLTHDGDNRSRRLMLPGKVGSVPQGAPGWGGLSVRRWPCWRT